MTTFHPTEAELLERWFEERMKGYVYNKKIDSSTYILFYMRNKYWCVMEEDDNGGMPNEIIIYPTSFEDIDTIIRIFTPKD